MRLREEASMRMMVVQRQGVNVAAREDARGGVGSAPPRNIRAALLNLQRTRGNSFVRRLLSGTGLHTPARYSTDAMKTDCDVKVHPDDMLYFFSDRSFRTVGSGTPVVIELQKDLKSKYPCLHEATLAHENKHVENAKANCQAFKKCVDDKSWSLFGSPTISRSAFEKCRMDNHGGLMANCFEDEKGAYEISISKATELSKQPKCAGEKSTLEDNIKFWQGIKDHAPNCTKK